MHSDTDGRGSTRHRWVAAALLAGVAAVGGCAHRGKFVWVDDVPSGKVAPPITSTIGAGDVIGVRVWNQEANSIDKARVREDGRISLPFLDDVEVAGMKPTELARRLEVKLKSFIVNPVVTVVVHERRPVRVSVLGQVTKAGVYDVEPGSGVLPALAAAGGLTPFADHDDIYVLRTAYWGDGERAPARIRFRYADLRTGKAPASTFPLRTGDVVLVE